MSNRVSTAPPKTAVIPRDVIAGPGVRSPHRWGARRRTLVAALVALLLLLSVVGVFAWRIISALNDAQGTAIRALPTQSSDVVFLEGSRTPTPDEGDDPTPVPGATNVTADLARPAGTPVALPSTTVGEAATPMPATASAGTPTVTITADPATATPDPDLTPLATTGKLSRLEIAQQIVTASMGNGDPGRSSIWQGKTHLNVLVLGVDKRPDGGDQNSDVILVARVDLLAKTVSAVSLPRDLWVDAPNVYTGKINGAYNAGIVADPKHDDLSGVAKVRDTIYAVYGIRTDGYVLIDFNGFEKVVDAVGGVDIVVPEPIHDDAYPTEDYGIETVDFEAGLQHMDGDRALKYVRTRHQDSDDGRRARQMDLLLALFDQGRDLGSIRKSDEIIVALLDTVQTGFGLEQQLTLARLGWEMDRTDIALTTLEAPLITGGPNADNIWVYSSDPAEVRAFIDDHLRNGLAAGS